MWKYTAVLICCQRWALRLQNFTFVYTHLRECGRVNLFGGSIGRWWVKYQAECFSNKSSFCYTSCHHGLDQYMGEIYALTQTVWSDSCTAFNNVLQSEVKYDAVDLFGLWPHIIKYLLTSTSQVTALNCEQSMKEWFFLLWLFSLRNFRW